MALNGTINGSVTYLSNVYTFYLEWSAVQNTTENYSDVTVKTYWGRKSGWTFDTEGTRKASITINGDTTSITQRFDYSPWVTTPIQTKTTRVYHDSDGSKSITISARANGHAATYGPSASTASTDDCTASGTITLNTIPRASQPSLITYPSTTADIGFIGDTITIYTNRTSTNFTHTIRYVFGTKKGNIGELVDNSTTWTIPYDLLTEMSIGKGTGTIYADTYNGSTLIGTKPVGFTVNTPDNSATKPVCTLTVAPDNSAITSSYASNFSNLYIKGISKVAYTITGSGKYGAKTSSWSMNSGNNSQTGTFASGSSSYSGVSSILHFEDDILLKATVKDARGITSENAEKNISVINYAKPQVVPYTNQTKIVCQRCDDNGNISATGTRLKITAGRSYFPVISGTTQYNHCVLRYRYKEASATSFGSWETLIDRTDTTTNVINKTITDIALDIKKAYDVEIGVIDDIGNKDSVSFDILSEDVTLHLASGGKKIGLGRYAGNKDNKVYCGWDFEADGKIIPNRIVYNEISFNNTTYPIYINIANIEITTTNADQLLSFTFVKRRDTSLSTVTLRFLNDSNDPDIHTFKTDSEFADVYIVKTEPSKWAIYISSSHTYTSISVVSMILTDYMASRISWTWGNTFLTALPEGAVKATLSEK